MTGCEGIAAHALAGLDADRNAQDDNGITSLSYAAYYSSTKFMWLLLAGENFDANVRDKHDQTRESGQTPHSWAARSGFEEILRIFPARDDVNAKLDKEGNIPRS